MKPLFDENKIIKGTNIMPASHYDNFKPKRELKCWELLK
jgi:hypothetical protein